MRNAAILIAFYISLTGCITVKCDMDFCPLDPLNNTVLVGFNVTEKVGGFPIPEAFVYVEVFRSYASLDPLNHCCRTKDLQAIHTLATDENGYCELTFSATYETVNDDYALHYRVVTDDGSKLNGMVLVGRQTSKTIDVRMLTIE